MCIHIYIYMCVFTYLFIYIYIYTHIFSMHCTCAYTHSLEDAEAALERRLQCCEWSPARRLSGMGELPPDRDGAARFGFAEDVAAAAGSTFDIQPSWSR